MKYFVFATLFISLTYYASAQDFFVPDNAFGVAQDHLASPVKNADKISFSQRRYRIIDGRVYPIEDNPVTLKKEDILATNRPILPKKEQTDTKSQTITKSQIPDSQQISQSSIENKNLKTSNVSQSTSIETDRNAIYQDLFKTYKEEREKFKKQHKFPKNQKLEDMLTQFKTPHNVTLFQNAVE